MGTALGPHGIAIMDFVKAYNAQTEDKAGTIIPTEITIYEDRSNGRLFLVRVQPAVGPPYHFVDVNGDGSLDYRPGEPVRNNVNQWILYRW